MKLSASLFLLSLASAATASNVAVKNLMRSARRVEDAAAAEEEEYAFLGKYSLKLVSCKSGETFVNAEGNTEYSSVVFRLCPSDTCSDTGSSGCSSGYGDYLVGINTFVQAYLEDKREDMKENGDDNFDLAQYGECVQWKVDKDAQQEGDENVYSVGPACSSDGTSIKLEFFKDECQTPSDEISFEDISNGLSLPYSTGGFVSSACESCAAVNDNGASELSEMCMNLYQEAGKCEDKMESSHYSGKQSGACESIASILPQKSKSGGAGKAIGWILFVLVVVGAAGAAYSYAKKKRANDDKSFGLMNA